MKREDLNTLNNLLTELRKEHADDWLKDKTTEELQAEVQKCLRLEEYKMMHDHMYEKLSYHRSGLDSGFPEHNFTLSFYHKTIQLENNADIFDAIYTLLKNEIDAYERGLK